MHLSRKFWKSSYKELRGICSFKPVESLWDNLIIEARPGLLHSLNSKDNIFIYGAFQLSDNRSIDKDNYTESIYASIKKQAERAEGKSIMIDIYDVNSKHGYSGKDMEVLFGNRLEKDGFKVSMDEPEVLVYAVLFNWRCYSGMTRYAADKRKLLNPIRHYNHSRSGISRAEMKIEEAFDRFSIKARKGIAIDLGAAPGGWSCFLAKRGFSVIAIDNAELDKKKIGAAGVPVEVYSDNAKPKRGTILHYKMGFQEAYSKLKDTKADLIADDMNISPAESAAAVTKYLSLLKENGICIMTIKSVTKNVPKHISAIKNELEGRLEIEKMAVLPSNRQELTILCRKRAGSR
jgi:23S rRNA (cytidine2498-2'-O)-methyltransferase